MGPVKYLSFKTKRRFGVEIEVTAHTEKAKIGGFIEAVDPNHKVKISEHNDKDYGNNHWNVKRDGSCKDKDFQFGYEVASFVGSGIEDISLVQKVATRLQQEGVKVNDNCSVHVHAEVADFSKAQLAKLVALWMKVEPVVLQMVPKRRHTSKYCVPLREFHKAMKLDTLKYKAGDFWHCVLPQYYDDKHRRVAFNICNICAALHYNYYGGEPKQKKRKTVELRLPEGTMDPRHIANWIKFFVRFVNLARLKKSPEDLKALSLTESMRVFGLGGTDEAPVILSRGLWSLKVWMLERIMEFGTDKEMVKEAHEFLNYISSPYRTYHEKEFKLTGKSKAVAAKNAGEGGKYDGLLAGFALPGDWHD
jgi:hypothetical protein